MFDTLSIRLKIVLLSGLCLLGVIALIVGINLYEAAQNNRLVSDSSSRMLTQSVQDLLQAKAAEQAAQLQKSFGESLVVITALADQVKGLRNTATKRGLEAGVLREELNQSLKTAFERNSKVLGIWLSFEPNGLDGKDSEFVDDKTRASNDKGRFSSYWSRAGGEGLNTVIVEDDLNKTAPNLSGTPYNIWYTCPRDTRNACLLDPYADEVAGKSMLMTTISLPLIVDGKVIGVIGLDLALNALQAATDATQKDLFNGAGYLEILSSTGLIAAFSGQPDKVGKNLLDVIGAEGKDIVQLLASDTRIIREQDNTIRAVYPVKPIADAKSWGVVIKLPKDVMLADAVKLQGILDKAQKCLHAESLAGRGRRRPARPVVDLADRHRCHPPDQYRRRDAQEYRQRRRRPHPAPGVRQEGRTGRADKLVQPLPRQAATDHRTDQAKHHRSPRYGRPVVGDCAPDQRRHAGAVPRNRPGRYRVQ